MTHDEAQAERTDETPSRAHGVAIFVRDLAIIVIAAILISAGIKTFLVRSFYIPTGSMRETLQVDDRIIVNQLVPELVGVERGDVIVFRDPGGWLNPVPQSDRGPLVESVDWFLTLVGLSASDSNDHLIKRVIGMPGDTVVCCDQFGHLMINDVSIEEPYLRLPQGVTNASGVEFEVTVPDGHLWVLGDNRYDSADSRYNTDGPSDGFVPIDHVVGRAFVVSWPIGHWSWLDNYPTVFSDVEDREPVGSP